MPKLPVLAFLAFLACVSCAANDDCEEGRVGCLCADGREGFRLCAGGCDCDTDAGVLDDGAIPDVPMVDGAVDGATDGAMIDGAADGGSTTCETEGAMRCGAAGEERCDAGTWTPVRPCPASCEDGACSDAPVSCDPGETRCFRSAVQRCNRGGTAWLFDSVCADGCSAGLCVGACTTGANRCNGDVLETCSDGSGFTPVETCALGCDRQVCVEDALINEGVVTELRGRHVYEGCVDVSLGGSLSIPAGETVEIWAQCLRVTESSSIDLGANARFRFHARETIDLDGAATGGEELFFEALDAMTLRGSTNSRQSVLRADALTLAAGSTTTGSTLNAALYGRAFTNDGTHAGIVSVMPPDPVESPTHPSIGVWNLGNDDLVVAWDRPFPSVMGYYIQVGDEVPGPGTGEYRTEEFVVLPAESLRPLGNRIRIVSVNADSEVGTYPQDVVVTLNVRPPTVTSTSHPDPSAWGGPDDVFLSWVDPTEVPNDALVGYLRTWDRMADTMPDATSTFDDRNMLLLSDQAPGLWYFHIVNLDRMGRPSPLATHYPVRIGPEPEYGNVAGTITRASDDAPIDGALVTLNGGAYRTTTGPSGDYTFRGEVPAASDPYRVTVRARGFVEQSRDVSIGAGTAAVEHFSLEDAAPPLGPIVRPLWPLQVSTSNAGSPDVAMDDARGVVWSSIESREGSPESVHITDMLAAPILSASMLDEYYDWRGARTDVGTHDGIFYAVDYYQCDDNGSLNYGHGWSCLRMQTWDRSGDVLAGWQRWRNSGHTGSPTAVWNGTSYGVFFVSYGTLYHRELTADLSFANGRSVTSNDVLSSGHGDSRQFARTQALWDGSGYAVAWSIERSTSDSSGAVFFGRWDRDLGVLQSRIMVDSAPRDGALGLTWDGAVYHLAYIRQTGADYDVVVRSISPTGTVGTPTVLAADVTNDRWQTPTLETDGRFLFATHIEADGTAVLDVLDPSDHRSVERLELGAVWAPRVTVAPSGGNGVVLYTTATNGTWIRPFELD